MQIDFTQRWRNGKPVFKVREDCFQPRIHDVAPLDEKTAKAFICRMHYSKSYPAARRRFGLYRRGNLIGVAVFSQPMSDKVLTNFFGGDARNSIELGRFVIADVGDDFNSESWFFAQCRRELRKEGFRGIVTFSDDLARTDVAGNVVFGGHLGVFYGASGGIYTGRSERTSIRLLPDGTVLSKRAVSKIRNGEQGHEYASNILVSYGAERPPADADARKLWLKIWLDRLTRKVTHPGNHRYLFGLQKSIRLPRSLPYPKIKFKELQPSLLESVG